MSQYLSLNISRSRAGRATKNRVLLEQEAWDPYVGMLTAGGVVAYLRDLLFGAGDGVQKKCGVDADGNVHGQVFAYPDPPELPYHAAMSAPGELGPAVVDELEYAEVMQIQMETEPSLRYPTSEILSASWVTDAFAQDGEVLPRPAVDISGGRVRIAKAVYGTLLVIYKVVRHTYGPTVPLRQTALENKYQDYVYAVWDAGTNFIEYQPPPDAEDGGRCNNFGVDDLTPDTDEGCEPPYASPEDLDYDVDYCDGTVTER